MAAISPEAVGGLFAGTCWPPYLRRLIAAVYLGPGGRRISGSRWLSRLGDLLAAVSREAVAAISLGVGGRHTPWKLLAAISLEGSGRHISGRGGPPCPRELVAAIPLEADGRQIPGSRWRSSPYLWKQQDPWRQDIAEAASQRVQRVHDLAETAVSEEVFFFPLFNVFVFYLV